MHDFRLVIENWIILKNGLIKEEKIPVLALTATATNETLNTISNKLKLTDPEIVKTSFYRDNLSITINEKQNFSEDISIIKKLIQKSLLKKKQ